MAKLDPALAQWALDEARRCGATATEVLFVSGESLEAGVRLGEIEKLKSSRERRLGIRAFVDKSSATASTAELEREALKAFIADTVRLARLTAPDPFSGLPDPALHPHHLTELELTDSEHGIIDADRALDIARRAERTALALDPRIKNSEGAGFDSGLYQILFANSQGFAGEYGGSSYSLGVAPIAVSDGAMQQGYWYTTSRHFEKLDEPESVGRISAERALQRLGARKVKTVRAPVIFEPDRAASLIRALVGAASGPSLYKGASFLVNRLGTQVAAPNVTIIDDGTMLRGLGSKPFDGEGLLTNRKAVVEAGVLKTYLLDSYSARKLKLSPTGNAARSVGDVPTVSPTNLYLEPGRYSPEEIIASVKQGLYVTELIGFGVNSVTGDYSRGASGVWIENGQLAFPVQEITIAGNLKEMFMAIEMIGNDLVWRSSTVAPTIKIAEMMIAGA
ncbi:MAG TPA: metallopeptidase TldD-related protein [Candidatus Binataceae bacterium]|nr:metallopeptidase TldD-related protein [Candidatus Binataceae bacterium]HVB80055.1 metallopeptidase TldD-related protein [Candidatus Binataceae bacterium]